jgi:hypothetical protein
MAMLTTMCGSRFAINYVWSDAIRHLTARGPNMLVKGWTFSGTIFKHTGFPCSIWSSNETATLQGSLFGSTSPATTTAVLDNVVGSPNVNCGSSAAQLVNGLPNPCYNAATFADLTNNFVTQRRNQFLVQVTSTPTSMWRSPLRYQNGRALSSPLAQGSLISSIIRTLPSQTQTRTAASSAKSPRPSVSQQTFMALVPAPMRHQKE